MKKLFSILSMTLLFLLLESCDKNETTCTTCESENFTIAKTTIFEKTFDLKRFASDSDESVFMYAQNNSANDLNYFYDILNEKGVAKISQSKLSGITIYTDDKELNNNHDYNIDLEDIKAILAYTKDNKLNSMITKLYIKKGNTFVEHELSNLKTNSISSNDIIDISRILFDNKVVTMISFFNMQNVTKGRTGVNQLRDKLSLNTSLFGRVAVKKCGRPCTEKTKNSDCQLFDSSQTGSPVPFWSCVGTCAQEEAEKVIVEKSEYASNYNFIEIRSILHSFKDNYLMQQNNGEEIVDLYYQFSGNLNLEKLSVSLCVETFDLINSDVIPMIQDIQNDPTNDSNVLIDNATKIKLIQYLEKVKLVCDDQIDKNNIDLIIQKVTLYTNKSNKFITTNL